MVEQNFVDIGRSYRTEVARKSRVDRSEDGDAFGLTESKRECRVHGFSGGYESRQFVSARDSRGDIPRNCEDVGDDLERLK